MQLHIKTHHARELVEKQLKELAEDTAEAFEFFKDGNIERAYQSFPYTDIDHVAENLETLTSTIEDDAAINE